MKKISKYILEKLHISKGMKSGIGLLSDLIYVVVRNVYLHKEFDKIAEVVVNRDSAHQFYSCFVSKEYKDELIKYYDGISCHTIRNPEKYAGMSLEEFAKKIAKQEIVGCFNHVGEAYIKSL